LWKTTAVTTVIKNERVGSFSKEVEGSGDREPPPPSKTSTLAHFRGWWWWTLLALTKIEDDEGERSPLTRVDLDGRQRGEGDPLLLMLYVIRKEINS
jgi:hypothetical protein